MNMQKTQNCCPPRLSKGFTLVEILIALGILAIGMSMVAALFPAAMEFNRRSTNSTLGTMICENGMVLSEMAITAEIIGAQIPHYGTPQEQSDELSIYADEQSANVKHLTKVQQHYPTGDAESRTGFAMLARKISPAGTTYQIVTVAYRKTDKDNTVALKQINCSISGRNITSASPANLRIGTPLINKATGRFAFVDSINSETETTPAGTTGTLDIDPKQEDMADGDYYVLIEKTSTGADIPLMRRSPAIGAMFKVTGLRHDRSLTADR